MNQPPLDYGSPAARFRFTRRQVKWIFCSLAAAPLFLFILFDVGIGRENESRLWPWIDTVTAPGYSESSFATIRTGMTRREVDALMCSPLDVVTLSGDGYGFVAAPPEADLDVGILLYEYTRDGRCPWGDFAWQGRAIWFQDGKVSHIFRGVYND